MNTNTVKIELDNSFGPHMIVSLMRDGNEVGNGTFELNEPERMTAFITTYLTIGQMMF